MLTENKIRECVLTLKKGQFLTVSIALNESDMDKKLRKRNNPYLGVVTKKTTYASVRICEYEKLADVEKERAEGKESSKPWYEWDVFPYIAKHPKTGNKYLVVKPTKKSITSSEYFVRGIKTDSSEIQPYLLKSSKDSRMFLVPFNQITSIKQGDINLGI